VLLLLKESHLYVINFYDCKFVNYLVYLTLEQVSCEWSVRTRIYAQRKHCRLQFEECSDQYYISFGPW
jgi:hypothetical protein